MNSRALTPLYIDLQTTRAADYVCREKALQARENHILTSIRHTAAVLKMRIGSG